MVDVFISYARANQPLVRQLAEAVQRLGYSVWWDDDLPPHLTYGEVISDKIGEAKAAIVVWSEDAAASEWVRAEADLARNQKKLIQTSIDGRMPPMPFNQIQFAAIGDWHGEDDHPGWTKVKASLAALCGAPGSPASAPTARPVTAPPTAAAPARPRRQPLLIPGLIGAAALAALGGFYLLWPHSPADNGTSTNQVAVNNMAPQSAATPPVQQAADMAAPGAEGTFTQAATIEGAAATDLRGGPSADALVVGRIARGEVFTTFPQQGDWWRVRTANGTIGYVARRAIRVVPVNVPPAQAAARRPTAAAAPHMPAQAPVRQAPVRQAPAAAPQAAVPTQPARPGKQAGPVPLQIQNMRRFCNGGPGAGTPQCIQFHQRMARQQMQRQ